MQGPKIDPTILDFDKLDGLPNLFDPPPSIRDIGLQLEDSMDEIIESLNELSHSSDENPVINKKLENSVKHVLENHPRIELSDAEMRAGIGQRVDPEAESFVEQLIEQLQERLSLSDTVEAKPLSGAFNKIKETIENIFAKADKLNAIKADMEIFADRAKPGIQIPQKYEGQLDTLSEVLREHDLAWTQTKGPGEDPFITPLLRTQQPESTVQKNSKPEPVITKSPGEFGIK